MNVNYCSCRDICGNTDIIYLTGNDFYAPKGRHDKFVLSVFLLSSHYFIPGDTNCCLTCSYLSGLIAVPVENMFTLCPALSPVCVSLLMEVSGFCRSLAQSNLLQQLDHECHNLCKLNEPSLHRDKSPYHLQHFDLLKLVNEWQERTVLLYEVLHTIMGTSGSSSLAKDVKKEESMAVAGAVLLHQRNDHTSAVQHALGLVLDFWGCYR